MLLKGKSALSDSELLGILIGSGTRSKSAVELGQELLSSARNDLNEFSKMSILQFQQIKGIGEAKAITIAAALELGRRRKNTEIVKRPQFKKSKDIYEFVGPYFEDLTIEKFYILALNRSNHLISIQCISEGGTSGTVVDGKIVFKLALEARANCLVLIHNHPSGSLSPSESDKQLTKQLVGFGRMIDLPILDHLIYTENGYYSFADNGDL
jgi:DNA repair protein RadC